MPGDYDPHQYRCENLKDLRLHTVHRFVTSGTDQKCLDNQHYCTGCVSATNFNSCKE
jgi:hypothetical protein